MNVAVPAVLLGLAALAAIGVIWGIKIQRKEREFARYSAAAEAEAVLRRENAA